MLKKELKASGYFDIEKKKRLPLFPFRVGIVTSASGAVIHDIIRTGFLRNNSVRYSLYSTTVQGENAAADMAEMVIRANEETEPPDILIIARGGGAEEDLTPFNQRVLLDAVFCSKIPVISAVGHETDVTLLDLAADVRASTPTQAAEIAVPDKKYIEERIICLYLVLQKIIRDKLNISKLKLQHTLTIFNILAQSGKVTAVRKDILYNWIILDRKLKKVISNKKLDILERMQFLSRCGMEDILICSKHIKGADDGKKFEDCMEELSSVVSQLQKEETPLEEMLVQYKKGTEAAMACLTILKETERDIHDISVEIEKLIQQGEETRDKRNDGK